MLNSFTKFKIAITILSNVSSSTGWTSRYIWFHVSEGKHEPFLELPHFLFDFYPNSSDFCDSNDNEIKLATFTHCEAIPLLMTPNILIAVHMLRNTRIKKSKTK